MTWEVSLYARKEGINSVGPRKRILTLNVSSAATSEEAIGVAMKIVTPNYSVLKVVSCKEVTP